MTFIHLLEDLAFNDLGFSLLYHSVEKIHIVKSHFQKYILEIIVEMGEAPDDPMSEIFGVQDLIEMLDRHYIMKTVDSNVVGFLLIGSSGLGKTKICQAVSKKYQNHFVKLEADCFKSYVGESEAFVKSLFDECARNAPATMLIDECDALLSQRTGKDGAVNNHVKQLILSRLSGMEAPKGLTVLASTNRPEDLDKAFISRFSQPYLFSLPDQATRYRYFRQVVMNEGKTTNVTEANFRRLNTEFFSFRELEKLTQRALDQVNFLIYWNKH